MELPGKEVGEKIIITELRKMETLVVIMNVMMGVLNRTMVGLVGSIVKMGIMEDMEMCN
jgi:hypothetical protein